MIAARTFVTLLVLTQGCAESSDDDVGSDPVSDELASGPVSATLLVSGDFSATSATKGIVQHELATNPSARLLAVGDMSYAAPYATNDPWATWAEKTYPVMGNHEFNNVAGTGGEQPFDLFNGHNAAGNHMFPSLTTSAGVHSYDFSYSYEVAPNWLLVVLNTGVNCHQQSCSDQAKQLTAWIHAWRNNQQNHGCVIVALHTARWSTMFSGDPDNLPWAVGVAPIWEAAIASSADIVLQGHVHVYEEFKKLGADGTPSANGVKLFTVGSGGKGQVKPLTSNISASSLIASHDAPINGVLKLALYAGSYGYRFETSATTTAPASSVACNMP